MMDCTSDQHAIPREEKPKTLSTCKTDGRYTESTPNQIQQLNFYKIKRDCASIDFKNGNLVVAGRIVIKGTPKPQPAPTGRGIERN